MRSEKPAFSALGSTLSVCTYLSQVGTCSVQYLQCTVPAVHCTTSALYHQCTSGGPGHGAPPAVAKQGHGLFIELFPPQEINCHHTGDQQCSQDSAWQQAVQCPAPPHPPSREQAAAPVQGPASGAPKHQCTSTGVPEHQCT